MRAAARAGVPKTALRRRCVRRVQGRSARRRPTFRKSRSYDVFYIFHRRLSDALEHPALVHLGDIRRDPRSRICRCRACRSRSRKARSQLRRGAPGWRRNTASLSAVRPRSRNAGSPSRFSPSISSARRARSPGPSLMELAMRRLAFFSPPIAFSCSRQARCCIASSFIAPLNAEERPRFFSTCLRKWSARARS